jgi:hypothetical protein
MTEGSLFGVTYRRVRHARLVVHRAAVGTARSVRAFGAR